MRQHRVFAVALVLIATSPSSNADDVQLKYTGASRVIAAQKAAALLREKATYQLPKKGPPIFTPTVRIPPTQRTLAVLGSAFRNPEITLQGDWAAQTCNNSRWMRGADFEWTPVLDPKQAAESKVVGVSGIVINEHASQDDVWFTHPFGPDWNANIAVDPGFEFVFAPGTPRPCTASSCNEDAAAVAEAKQDGLEVSNALHVEFDGRLISSDYRAQKGMRLPFLAVGSSTAHMMLRLQARSILHCSS